MARVRGAALGLGEPWLGACLEGTAGSSVRGREAGPGCICPSGSEGRTWAPGVGVGQQD